MSSVRRLPTAAALALAAMPVAAQEIRDCDRSEAGARNLVFPLEENVRSYARGRVHLLALDTGGEPACCSVHLMVLLPDPELPGDTCVLVSDDGGLGWYGLALSAATAAYDPGAGLAVSIPAARHGAEAPIPFSIALTVNQQSGVVQADFGEP